ncbi:MAG: hypothetical protein ABJ327_21145 [Litoreibacter sp.]
MIDKVEGGVVVELVPSMMRRVSGAGVLYALGLMMIYIAMSQPPEGLHWILLLFAAGGVSVFGGYKMWELSDQSIELTQHGLRMSDGTVIAGLADIVKVDRSFFAFKPSNGFVISLNVSHPIYWVPGLWWRVGKQIGVGGLTPAGDGKALADTLSALLAERDGLVTFS